MNGIFSLFRNKTIYSLTPIQMQMLIAEKLGVDVGEVHVKYVIKEVDGDPLDRWPGTDEVTEIEITVEPKS